MFTALGGGAAISAYNRLERHQRAHSAAIEKLATGKKINRASDDPAGMVISTQLRSQISDVEQAIRNTQSASNLLDVADGALASLAKPLAQAAQLALHAANDGITSDEQIAADQSELDGILKSIDKIASTTAYAGQHLLDGSGGGNLQLSEIAGDQVGFGLPKISLESLGKITLDATAKTPAETPAETIVKTSESANENSGAENSENLWTSDLGGSLLKGASLRKIDGGAATKNLELPSFGADPENTYSMADLFAGGRAALAENPEAALQVIEQAQKDLADYRANLGAMQSNLLDSNVQVLSVKLEKLTAAESAISDVDIAQVATEKVTAEVRLQSSIFGIQQLKQNAGNVLSLLGA